MRLSQVHSKNQQGASISRSMVWLVPLSRLLLEEINSRWADLTGSLTLQALNLEELLVAPMMSGLIQLLILSLTTTLASLVGRWLTSVIPTSKLQSSSPKVPRLLRTRPTTQFINTGQPRRTIDSKTKTLSTSTGCKNLPMEASSGTTCKEDNFKARPALLTFLASPLPVPLRSSHFWYLENKWYTRISTQLSSLILRYVNGLPK